MGAKPITGLSELLGLYDGFILDLWGVVHDGVAPFRDTIPALTALKQGQKKVWLLSNAPRRSYTVVTRLAEMGISPGMYDGVLTSGEMSWQALRDTLLAKWGKRCFHIGPARDKSLYEELDIELADGPSGADFVLNSGVVDFDDTLERYQLVLHDCLRHRLPMLCANPDRMVHVENQLVICAGTFAELYEGMGGEVISFGKPYREVYRRCLSEMGTKRVLAVGDSMLTDIKGATGAGLDSVLVLSGLHREETGENELQDFLAKYPFQPDYLMKSFAW
jgi:HAD superfamily hydrolase (TIGR01459 family)